MQGADQAIDADTAIIRGDPRHPDLTGNKRMVFLISFVVPAITFINQESDILIYVHSI